MALLRLKYHDREYRGFPLWRDGRGAYRVECGERVLGVVFGEVEFGALVRSDRAVDLAKVPLESRTAPKMVNGKAID